MPPQRKIIEANPATLEVYREVAEQQAARGEVEKTPDTVTELQAKRTEIDRTTTRLQVFLQCAEHGLQTIIDRFGAQQFAEAFAGVDQGPHRKENATLVDVLKVLEPESEARAALYTEIDEAATALDGQVETQTPEQLLEAHSLDDASFSPSHGDVVRMRATSDALRALDGTSSKIVGAKITALLNKSATHWLSLTMDRLRTFGIQHEPEVFAQTLQERGEGNLRVAAQEMQMDVEESSEVLFHEIAVAQAELRAAHAQETGRAQTEANGRIQRLSADISKLAHMAAETEGVERAVDDAAARAIEEMQGIEEELATTLARTEARYRGLNAALAQQATPRW